MSSSGSGTRRTVHVNRVVIIRRVHCVASGASGAPRYGLAANQNNSVTICGCSDIHRWIWVHSAPARDRGEH